MVVAPRLCEIVDDPLCDEDGVFALVRIEEFAESQEDELVLCKVPGLRRSFELAPSFTSHRRLPGEPSTQAQRT